MCKENSRIKKTFETLPQAARRANSSGAHCNSFSLPRQIRSLKSAVSILRPVEFISFAWRHRVGDKRMRFLPDPSHHHARPRNVLRALHFNFPGLPLSAYSNISPYRGIEFIPSSRAGERAAHLKPEVSTIVSVYDVSRQINRTNPNDDNPYERGNVDSQQALIMYTHCGR